jgi:hypothetical protein
MRESRTYGSVRGARDEIRVPTATGVDGPLAASRCQIGVSGEITVRAAKLTRAPHISTARIVRTGWFYPYRKSRPITGAHGFSTTGRLLAKGQACHMHARPR